MGTKFQQISMTMIINNKYQTRTVNEDEDFQSLVESIRTQGILQPLCVRLHGDKFEIMAGHRRYEAAKYIGMEAVPCSIMDGEKLDPWAVAFHENVYRKDMTPIEEAAFVVDSMKKGPYTAEELSPLIRKSSAWIRERVTMCDWPADLSKAVHEGHISVSAARNLAQITDDQARGLLIKCAIENGVSARTTAAWLQGYKANEDLSQPEKIEPVPGQTFKAPPMPMAPCLICANPNKMNEMAYLPVCGLCQNEVIGKVQEMMSQQGT